MSTTEPTTLVILGASGDLTKRLLLPGLGTLLATQPQRQVRVIGAAHNELTDEAWREIVDTALTGSGVAAEQVSTVMSTTSYHQVDVMAEDSLRELLSRLSGPSVLYFALPPHVTAGACAVLEKIGVPEHVSLALEKPFGVDLESARQLNALLSRIVPESRTFRVDHFLGTTMVLNVLGLRFANRIFEPVWSAKDIERVEITFNETLALEGRAGYYDKAGALADMLQSHLLLVMAMVAMEEPAKVDAVEVRDLMAHVLRAASVANPVTDSRRGRYTAGRVADRDVPDYTAEPGVDPTRNTETFAELTVTISNSRWAGTPFVLRSGKAVAEDVRHIRLIFKPVAHAIAGLANQAQRNELVIGMGPDHLTLHVNTNGAGDKFALDRTVLNADLGMSPVHEYGSILAGILDGDPLLSVRGDVAEQCWRIVEPVLAAWRANDVELEGYPAGSEGLASR